MFHSDPIASGNRIPLVFPSKSLGEFLRGIFCVFRCGEGEERGLRISGARPISSLGRRSPLYIVIGRDRCSRDDVGDVVPLVPFPMTARVANPSMHIIETPSKMREEAEGLRRTHGPLGLVPTMGALHDGHLSLIRQAVRECGSVVVSIFVNPTQFGEGEDLNAYPRTFEADVSACRVEGVPLVYAPRGEAMYPPGFDTWVEVPSLSKGLCGPHRPGHFRGVATVVMKLFAACLPHRAYFGEKDYQQLLVIRRMARDMDLGVEVVGCPTVREEGELAMSSRNAYLSEDERARALFLNRGLRRAAALVAQGVREVPALVAAAREEMGRTGVEIEYISVVDPETLEPLETVDGPARIAVSARVGRARLIDNMALEP